MADLTFCLVWDRVSVICHKLLGFFYFPSHHRRIRVIDATAIQLYVGSRDSISGLLACLARASLVPMELVGIRDPGDDVMGGCELSVGAGN